MSTRIALIGGSFNPPHIGHLMAAVYVRATLAVDEVWLVPAFNHPFGKPLAPFEDRVAMCALMSQNVGDWLTVSRAEAFVGKEGRTIDLLEWLLPQHPGTEFHWVIGSDILADLPKWKSWDRISSLVKVTVLHRAGYPSTEALGPPMAEVSSTEIRTAFEARRLPSGLVAKPVLDYVVSHQLYGYSNANPTV